MWKENNKANLVQSGETKNITDNGETRFYDFANVAIYSPVCYVPQALGILIARQFSSRIIVIFYVARLFNFIASVILLFLMLRAIPILKWLFTYLALLPMTLFLNISLSADVMTNAACFLLLAYVLRLRFLTPEIGRNQIVILSVLVIMLASVKIVYLILLFVVLVLPKNKFTSNKIYRLSILMLLSIGLGVGAFWSYIISDLYIPYVSYNPIYRDLSGISTTANLYEQLTFISADYTRLFSVVFLSIRDCYVLHIEGYIGLFGWSDTKLPTAIVYTLYAIILIIAANENDPKIILSLKNRFLFFVVFMLMVSLIFLSQYLSWVDVGANSVWHIQGRYFIPAYPLFFILFFNFFKAKHIVAPLAMTTILLSLIYTTIILYFRYYGDMLTV